MNLDQIMKSVVEGAAYLSLTSMNEDGTPHPIIVGKGAFEGKNIVFGVHKMHQTQQNLLRDNRFWVVAATREDGPKGYRFGGTASVSETKLIFCPETAETLI